MCGQRPAFWFNLKASSGALSIGVSSSHMNLAHVVGAMIVVARCGDGMEGKGALYCPHHANASAAAETILYRQPIGTATLETLMVPMAILESRRGGCHDLGKSKILLPDRRCAIRDCLRQH